MATRKEAEVLIERIEAMIESRDIQTRRDRENIQKIRDKYGIPDPIRLSMTKEEHVKRLEADGIPWSHIIEHIRDDQTKSEYLEEVAARARLIAMKEAQ